MTNDGELHNTAEENGFLSGSNVYRHSRPGELGCSAESSSLDESWPDSERNSTIEWAWCHVAYTEGFKEPDSCRILKWLQQI